MTAEADRTRRPFIISEASQLLSRTPGVLDSWLRGLPDPWLTGHEGGDTWSPFDIVGHLVHVERTDWMPRARRLLEHGEAIPFDPLDRVAHFREAAGKSMNDLLDDFVRLRQASLQALHDLALGDEHLERRGRHPAFGAVTLRELLAAWVAHDQDHIAQIARVFAKQYSGEVGPWARYLRVISGSQG